MPGKVTSKLGSTMYSVLLNDGRNVRKHADQIRSRMENDQSDSSVERYSDIDDSLEMRVPRTNEQSDSNDDATVELNSGESTSTTIIADNTNSHNPEQEPDTSDGMESSLPQLRRSNRQRNQTDFYGVVPISFLIFGFLDFWLYCLLLVM